MASTTYAKDPIITKYLSSFRTNDINGIKTSLIEESTYRQLFARQPDDVDPSQLTLLNQPYLNLINIYENEDIWKIKNRYFNNESGNDNDEEGMYVMPLSENKRFKHDDPAICLGGSENFQKNWNLFTESSLIGLDWSNVFAAGGAVLSCLLPIPKEYSVNKRKIREWYHKVAYIRSDIDLFIYGLDEEAAKKKMVEIYEAVRETAPLEVGCFRSKNCVTILSQCPYRHIQIVLRLYKSPSEVLTGFDVDCCSVGFDGKNVWALPRAHQAIIKQCNVVDMTRRSPSYEIRLAKYTDRGFEIKIPSLKRSRIDPTIYEKSFEKLHGLARLLVLERLKSPNNWFKYVKNRHERSCRPEKFSESGTYSSRKWEKAKTMKVGTFESSDYEAVALPYGSKFDAKKIMRFIYLKDMALNSKLYPSNNERVLHRHICFFSTDMKQIFDDCCGCCPVPSNPEEIATQIKEDKIFVRGKMEFIKDDPGRQTVGSFHPLTDDDWTTEAYITDVREDLCSACARGAADIVENLLKQNSLPTNEISQIEKVDVEMRDFFGRTPLQLAVLGGHTEVVRILLQHNARIITRMVDGKTVVHLASQYGFLDILELLLQKSDENKKKIQEQEYAKSLLESNNQKQSTVKEDKKQEQQETKNNDIVTENSFEMIDKMEICQKPSSKDEEEQDDIIDLNAESWDHPLAPLDYAILFGQVEIVKRLVKAGANVRRPIKLRVKKSYYFEDKLYFPLGLCLLIQNQKAGLEIATILLENGATSSQLDYQSNSILHLAVRTRKTQFVKLLFDIDPESLRIINSVNFSLESPLYLAVTKNHLGLTELLIKHGARAYITLEDVKEYNNCQKYKSYKFGYDLETTFKRVNQPLARALRNNLYRVLIEAGADVNCPADCNYPAISVREYVENLIRCNEIDIEEYEEELACLNEEIKSETKISNEKVILQYLNELLEEKKRDEKGSYKEYVLNNCTAETLYNIIQHRDPRMFPSLYYNKPSEINKLETTHTKKLLESETKKLNYNKECLEYLIKHGAKNSKEVALENDLEIPKKLMMNYQEQLNTVKKLLEGQAGTLTTEEEERHLKEETLLQEVIDKQQEEIDKIYRNYQEPVQKSIITKQPLEVLSRDTLSSLININFDEFMSFGYLGYKNSKVPVPEELVPTYVKLFQAIYVNDVSTVEMMSHSLVFAVRDGHFMTPFTLACLRGHNELAVKILDIVASQYVPRNAEDLELVPDVTAYEFLSNKSSFVSKELIPEEFLKRHKLYQENYPLTLNGFEVAVLRNDLETVKRILDWAEKYQYVEDINLKKAGGGLVTYLIRGNLNYNARNPMIDSICFGYVDMMDIFIEYAAGGNNFSIFDIKGSEGENLPDPKFYQGLNVNGSKKHSWMFRYNPNSSNKPVEPSYLFYAAYYGNITSIQYFFSERPMNALRKYAQKYANNSDDLRGTILNTIEDIQKVGRKLFTYELFRNETPFHWAVLNNKHDVIKELARLYEERESKEQMDDEEQQLTLEEILDMRADERKVTALLLAAQFGYNECIKTLLEVGADPGITDCNGWCLAHYAVNRDNKEMVKLLHELLQPETYQRMLEQRSKPFNHTPISISILNSNVKLTEYLLQQVTTANLFIYDFEINRYLHLSLKEGLCDISKKLIELETTATTEVDKKLGSLYHENSFGQTPTEIAIQMFLNRLVSVAVFEPPPSRLSTELKFNNNDDDDQIEKENSDSEATDCVTKAFNLMVPFYLPRNQGNSSSKRVWVGFNVVNDTVHKLIDRISGGSSKIVESKETNTKTRLNVLLHNY